MLSLFSWLGIASGINLLGLLGQVSGLIVAAITYKNGLIYRDYVLGIGVIIAGVSMLFT